MREPMDVDELAAIVRPWAEANMPEAWAKTVEQANRPNSYRKFLARLITRWYEAKATDKPSLSIMQESDARIKMRTQSGREFDVCGRHAEGDQMFDFDLLSIVYHSNGLLMDDVLATIDEFDAVIDRAQPRPLSAFKVAPKPPEVKATEAPKTKAKPDPSVVLELLPATFRSRDD